MLGPVIQTSENTWRSASTQIQHRNPSDAVVPRQQEADPWTPPSWTPCRGWYPRPCWRPPHSPTRRTELRCYSDVNRTRPAVGPGVSTQPYFSPPVLLGVLLSVLDHVLDVVFAQTSWWLDHDWQRREDTNMLNSDSSPGGGVAASLCSDSDSSSECWRPWGYWSQTFSQQDNFSDLV